MRGDLIALHRNLKGVFSEEGVGLFSKVTNDNSFMLHQCMLILDVRKNFFIERLVKIWNRLHSEMVQ